MSESWDSSVNTVTRPWVGQPGSDSQQGIFLFATVSRLAPAPSQPPIQWVPEALFLRVKWPGHGPNHSLPSNAKVKNVWS